MTRRWRQAPWTAEHPVSFPEPSGDAPPMESVERSQRPPRRQPNVQEIPSMPRVEDLKESKFLQKGDVGRGLLLTITGCEQFDVAMAGAEEHLKWCLTFAENEKPLVLNQINAQLCAQILGNDDTDFWKGGSIVLFVDPTVAYKGKVVGGIRVRAPKPGSVAPKPAPVVPMDDSDIPF